MVNGTGKLIVIKLKTDWNRFNLHNIEHDKYR